MGLLKRGPKKPSNEEIFQEESALQEAGRKTPSTEDYLHSLGQSALMIIDPEVLALLLEKPKYRNLIPAFSHLNRISNIGPLEAEILELDYEALLLLQEMFMKESKYNASDFILMMSLGMHSRFIIADSYQGHKAKVITEQTRVIRTELTKPKKGRFIF